MLYTAFFYLKNIVLSVIHIILFVMKNIYHPAVLILTVNSFKTQKPYSVEENKTTILSTIIPI